MADLTLPKSLLGVELIKSVRTPAELRYQYTAGAATTRFLTGLAQKKIFGERCPKCGKVYVPPRGSCASDGVPTTEQVDLPHVGTVTSFCIVNVQFYGQAMEVPYTSALILLDGADLSLMHLLQEVAVEDVHIGMRVEDSDGRVLQEIAPGPKRRLDISSVTRSTILSGLRAAANDPGGTSAPVFQGFPITVAGKTGTAERGPQGNQSWYVVIAPYNDPRVVVAVTVERGGFGAVAAAPAARRILAAYFGIKGKKAVGTAGAAPN